MDLDHLLVRTGDRVTARGILMPDDTTTGLGLADTGATEVMPGCITTIPRTAPFFILLDPVPPDLTHRARWHAQVTGRLGTHAIHDPTIHTLGTRPQPPAPLPEVRTPPPQYADPSPPAPPRTPVEKFWRTAEDSDLLLSLGHTHPDITCIHLRLITPALVEAARPLDAGTVDITVWVHPCPHS
jgi:hypothetical protein